jgi:hypothetical protein
MSGRPLKQVVSGQGGLFSGPPAFHLGAKIFRPPFAVENRFVCLPREQKIKQICGQVAPLASRRGGCPTNSPRQVGGGPLCKPPLVRNSKISPTLEGFSSHQNFDGRPLVGFDLVVAPINKNENPRDPLPKNFAPQGDVFELLGGKMPPPRWPLICLICSGKFWRGEKYKLTPLTIFSPEQKA